MIIISLFLLGTLMPNLSFTAHVNVGIVNGREAEPHSRPYMVSVQYSNGHFCGGFLISDEFVMTAAHCRPSNIRLTVVVGAHDLTQANAGRYGVKTYYMHPQYRPVTIENDILLLRLTQKVQQSDTVSWISIPTSQESIQGPCSVAGWGRLSTHGRYSSRLMEADMQIQNDSTCERKWGKTFVASVMFCAHGAGGSCFADSGGPFVCGNTAVGITSFGSSNECNSASHPNVYAKISAFLPWINSIIQSAD